MEQGARPNDPEYLKVAFSKRGLSEIEGARHERQVLAMYAAAGHPEVKDDETPWCAAFVGWCLKEAGLPNTGSLLAKSYAKYGTPTPFNGFRVPRGAICVWTRTGGNHVNFCLEDDGTYLTCIGGNQENSKGGGVTVSKRAKSNGLIATVLPASQKVKTRQPPDVQKPKPKETKPAVQSTEIWSQLAAIIAAIGSVVTDVRFLALIVVLFCAYQIWKRYERGDIGGWFK